MVIGLIGFDGRFQEFIKIIIIGVGMGFVFGLAVG